MTVRVTSNNVLMGVGGTFQFSDDFVRAATSSGAGEEYVSGPQPGVIEAVSNQIFTNGVAFNIRAASTNAVVRTSLVFWPKPIIPFVQGSQFAQFTAVGDTSVNGTANLSGGVFLLAGWQPVNLGYRDYGIGWEGPDGGPNQNSLRLRRMNGVSSETALGTTATGTAVIGAVIRAEVTVLPTQNEIEVFINGVSALSVIDNSALRPMVGNPGIGRMLWISGGVPGTRNWQAGDFSCGRL